MKKWVPEWVSAFLILLFTYTALSKLLALDKFVYILSQSPLLDKRSLELAITIPLLELGLVVFLLIPGLRKIGLTGSLILLAAFTGYLLYMVTSASHLPCSCGGIISKMTWKEHIGFNLLVCGLALAAITVMKPDNSKVIFRN